MEVSVNLQEPFSYSIIPMIVIIILTFVIAIYIIIKACNKVRKEKNNITKIKYENVNNIIDIVNYLVCDISTFNIICVNDLIYTIINSVYL